MASRSAQGRVFLIFALVWIATFASSVAAEPNWPVIAFTPVLSGVGETVDIQNAADGSGRLFLVRQSGKIQILKNGALLPAPLLDVGDRIQPYGEQGLLGLAFPPGFAVKKCFYIYYCRKGDGATVLSRFRMSADPNVALPLSEEILLTTPKPDTNHNGGQLVFGPDGFLYLSIGDGGGSGDPQRNSQKLTNRLGKILRIDVNNISPGLPYAIPASNPFATSPTNSREILCWGLRNPWRFSFDSLTGGLFIGDVGEQQREEINFIPAAAINAGTNFGWSVKEGTLDYIAQTNTTGILQSPAFEYGRALGASVTGGHVYRGSNPRLHGFYLFGDFETGRIWAMEHPAAGGRVAMLKDTTYNISTFGKDETGEIYFADYFRGGIYRIDAPHTLPPPVISPVAGIYTYTGGFSYSIRTDVPGAIIRYTTDGTLPDGTSPVFPAGTSIQKNEPFMLKAAAFRADFPPGPAAEAFYQFRPGTVALDRHPSSNNYMTWCLSTSTPGAEIRYTIDGSEPTTGSLLYNPLTGVFINRHNLVVRAVAIKIGNGWVPSDSASWRSGLYVSDPMLSSRYSDLYDPIQIVSATTNCVFRYTIDGTQPTPQSPVWTGPRHFPANTVLKVLATKEGMESRSASLDVIKISAQETRFEKVPGTTSFVTGDLIRINDSDFYALSYRGLWKLAGGTWTQLHQGSISQTFTSMVMTPDGKIAIAFAFDSGSGGIRFINTSGTVDADWHFSSMTPEGLISMPAGDYIVADSWSDKILRISGPGAKSIVPAYDAPDSPTIFNDPLAVASDASGEILVSTGDGRIRRIGADGMVTNIASNIYSGWTDGPVSTARFEKLISITTDRIGNIYVCDTRSSNGKIRKISPDLTVGTLRGPFYEGSLSSPPIPDSLGPTYPANLNVDENGVLYIAGDYGIVRAIQEDWDNDGIPDTSEIALGAPFVVGIDDRLADADGDLFSNAAERIASTNALLATSRPTASTVTRLADGTVSLQFPCAPGRIHQLEYSDDLQDWKPMGIPSTSPLRSFTARFIAPTLSSQRYYRLRSYD